MIKFIEVHDEYGQPFMLNLHHILALYPRSDKNACTAETTTDMVFLQESYEEIRRMVGSAQGGIPMEGSRQY